MYKRQTPPVLFIQVTPTPTGVVRNVGVRDQGRGIPGGDRVFEHAFGGADVRDGVRARVPDEAVVLEQTVVRPAGEDEDRQLEGVQRRQSEHRGVGLALCYGGAVKPVEVVTDEDIVRAQPVDELAVCPFEPRTLFAFPEAFLALSASSHCVKGAVAAKLDDAKAADQMDSAELERLRSLGYVQ